MNGAASPPLANAVPLPPDDQLEDAIVLAGLSLATAPTPQQRAQAWDRLRQLKDREREIRGDAA